MGDQGRLQLRIKGDREASRKALSDHGVKGAVLVHDDKADWTCWEVLPSQWPAVVTWYSEPAMCAEKTGFPAGTLLFYS